VASTFDSYDKSIDDYEKYLEEIKTESKKSFLKFNWIGGLTAMATFVGLIVLVITTWMLVDSAFEKLNDASNIVKTYKKQDIDFRGFVLKSDYDDLKQEVNKLKRKIQTIGEKKKEKTINNQLHSGEKTNP